jgi:hypothetical protein
MAKMVDGRHLSTSYHDGLGKAFAGLQCILFDHLPMCNKFRAPTII